MKTTIQKFRSQAWIQLTVVGLLLLVIMLGSPDGVTGLILRVRDAIRRLLGRSEASPEPSEDGSEAPSAQPVLGAESSSDHE